MSFTVKFPNGETKTFEKKVKLLDLLDEEELNAKQFLCAKVNNRVRDLNYEVYYDADIEFMTIKETEAMKIYEASLRYIIAMAFKRCYPDYQIRFTYNVSRCIGLYIKGERANMAMLLKVSHEIDKIVEDDLPLIREIIPNEDAVQIYKENGFEDKIELLPYRPEKTVHIYECDGYKNYMYSHLVPSTGYIKKYKIRLYAPGMLIQYPRADEGGEIPPFKDEATYGRTLQEVHEWARTIGVDTVPHINDVIKHNGDVEFINMCESRHNRMLAELGQLIEDDIENIRLICVAGPSSSGKTTFANRLRIELLSRGIKPIRISMDDYYRGKSEIPLGEDGKPDFETIEALDLEKFQADMLSLTSGEETVLPKYSFGEGKAHPFRTVKLGKEEPVIIEGIHALNELSTSAIPSANKFKIFISPQAQINLDEHNPVSLTDLRLLRRLVRDKKFRAAPAEETFEMWPKVRLGEFKWIYSNQEGCDYVFNSFLPYELPVMKKYAMPLLQEVDKDSPYFLDAERLMRMLKFFSDLDDQWVPSNSLMREFIGGSCYADV